MVTYHLIARKHNATLHWRGSGDVWVTGCMNVCAGTCSRSRTVSVSPKAIISLAVHACFPSMQELSSPGAKHAVLA